MRAAAERYTFLSRITLLCHRRFTGSATQPHKRDRRPLLERKKQKKMEGKKSEGTGTGWERKKKVSSTSSPGSGEKKNRLRPSKKL